MRMSALLVVWVALAWPLPAPAQESAAPEVREAVPAEAAEEEDEEGGARIERFEPEPLPMDAAPRTVAVPGPPAGRAGSSPGAGGLAELRAVSLARGEARVLVEGAERVLRPGDAVGSDVVTRVEPGRIVLVRAPTDEAPEGEATVVVDFGEDGAPRVRVYHVRNPER